MPAGWRIVALLALVSGSPADAEPGGEVAVAVVWRPSDGCLDSARLFEAVGARSRRHPVRSAAEADAVISGRAAFRPEGGWQVDLAVADRRGVLLGRRSLVVADAGCDALRDHVALVVAMLIDSSVVEQAAASAPPSPPGDAAGARWRGDAALSLLAEAGRLPGAVPGLGIGLGVDSPGGWRAEIELAAFAEASAADDSGRTSLRWLAGALAGCAPGLRPDGWVLTGCAGLEVGAVLAEGAGFTRNQDGRELLLDGLARLRVERRLAGPTFLALGLALRVAALRPRFGYQDEAGVFQPLYEPSWAAASGQVGLGAHFP